MADNVTANSGSGGPVFATEDVSSVHYPKEKLVWGGAGTVNLVDNATSKRFPVNPVTDDISAQYHIKKPGITDQASVNLAFGFTSRRLRVRADKDNTADVAIDFLGGTAAYPQPGTAGHRILSPGEELVFENFCVASISVIAASGIQTLSVSAFK